MVKKVLILDDMLHYVAQHNLKLREAGIECEYTQCGREAVEMATEENSPFKVVLVDEILLEPNGQTQHWQGRDVRNEIRGRRKDIHFIVISSKPQQEREKRFHETGDFLNAIFFGDRTEAEIRREPQVVQLVSKSLLDHPESQDEAYDQMISQIKELLKRNPAIITNQSSQVVTPAILVGFGLDKETIGGTKPRRLTDFFQAPPGELHITDSEIRQKIRHLRKSLQASKQNSVLEKKIFYLKAGTKEYKPLEVKDRGKKRPKAVIGLQTRYFSILEWLAWKSEVGEEPEIKGDDFLYVICKNARPASCSDSMDDDIDEGTNNRMIQGIRGIEESQGLGAQQRASIENINPRQYHNLSVAMNRLRGKLVEANIGFENGNQIFVCYEGETLYRPLFRIGIVVYPVALRK